MPIYEFRCRDCAQRFDELVRGSQTAVACTSCGSERSERLMSSFAGIGSRSDAMPAHPRLDRPQAGAGCGGGCGCHHRH